MSSHSGASVAATDKGSADASVVEWPDCDGPWVTDDLLVYPPTVTTHPTHLLPTQPPTHSHKDRTLRYLRDTNCCSGTTVINIHRVGCGLETLSLVRMQD